MTPGSTMTSDPAALGPGAGAPVELALLAAGCLAVAVLLWPRRLGTEFARRALGAAPESAAAQADSLSAAAADTAAGAAAARFHELWRADPAELFRQWRLRRRPAELVGSALALLEGVAPALRAGLPPSTALALVASVMGSDDRDAAILLAALDEAAGAGRPIAPVWRAVARRSGSRELAFVGAAWHLSESTGAPLAEAVERAVAMLRAARERERRVAVAVAGPKATVGVLTVLPMTGPLFGLACGVGPVDLYLSSSLGGIAALAGAALIWVGRWWCRRLVVSATGSGRGQMRGQARRHG